MLRRLLERATRGRRIEQLRTKANALFDAGRHTEALAAYERLLAEGDDLRARVNLGYCLLFSSAPDRAEACFRAALADLHTAPNARVGLGDAAAARGEHAVAVEHYREAIALQPDFAVAHNNLALSLTAQGEFEEAYREAEWRYALADTRAIFPHPVDLLRWQGEPLTGQRLLVHWEQGFGDIIQHLRFLPLLRERGIRFVFDCPPPLLPLARRVTRTDELRSARADGLDVAGFDRAVPLLSLPHLLGIGWPTVPRSPYVSADPVRSKALGAAWRTSERKLAGVAWRSSSFDATRDIGLETILEVLESQATRCVALQVDVTAEERAILSAHDAVVALDTAPDFGLTADSVAAVDLVLSVDTVIAHLAGAMGRPTWVILNEPAAVRWMIGREDSPWYPTMCLLRRARSAPAEQLVAQLSARLATVRGG